MPQFRGDVSAILLASAEALTWLATDADSIANYAPDGGVISAVHAKCRHLVAVLAAVSSPRDEFTAAVSAAEKKLKKGRSFKDVRNDFIQLLTLVSNFTLPPLLSFALISVCLWGCH